MDIWWLALDRERTRYDEIKARRVIAQGWPQVGDLRSHVELARDPVGKGTFVERLQSLCRVVYGPSSPEIGRAPFVMWKLLRIQRGDLLVGIEGREVLGIAKAPCNGAEGYWYEPRFHYAQCVGRDVAWFDWSLDACGAAPTAPAQSVLGLAHVQKDREKVLTAWSRLQSSGS